MPYIIIIIIIIIIYVIEFSLGYCDQVFIIKRRKNLSEIDQENNKSRNLTWFKSFAVFKSCKKVRIPVLHSGSCVKKLICVKSNICK